MYDRSKKAHRGGGADERLRRQIAVEAARRLMTALGPDAAAKVSEASAAELFAAKRKAVGVLGRRVRPADMPDDAEVREQVRALARAGEGPSDQPEEEHGPVAQIAEHLDRFALFRLRLQPLEAVKLDPVEHPEGDALYHSLQAFERAREARPYDEEFLLAALLHEVGRAVDPKDSVKAALEALGPAIPERTARLIEHHEEGRRTLKPSARRTELDPDDAEDLALLREVDAAARVPGAHVGTVDEALDYLAKLEAEEYLDDEP